MANYPTSPTTFATRSNGQTIDASHVNTIQEEITAIEDGLLSGTARLNSSNSTVANLSVTGGSTFAGATTFSTGITLSTGSITLNQGQIVFPATQVASAGANTLDDYEEGSWTPVIGGAGGTSGQTYAVQVGRYVKIGKLVMAQCYVELSAKGTITGAVQIQGLPATSENTTNLYAPAAMEWRGLATTWVNVIARVDPGGTTATVEGTTAAGSGNITQLATADIGNGTGFMVTLAYRADS